MDVLKQLIKQFMPFAQEQMGFNRPPKLFLRQDAENGANPLGKTGFYDPQAESITIYVSNRHPKDILRSLSHELMHHTQNCNGDFDNEKAQGMGEQGYAQNNAHMRTMEIQAYQASIVFRDWEDSLKETIYYEHLQKGDKKMSTKDWKNGELTTLLSEAWGFGFKVDRLNEEGGPGGIRKVSPEAAKEDEEELEGDEPKRLKQGNLEEDSGYDEKEHDEHNAWNDEDHIEAIEKHLRALKHDRDYEEGHEELEENWRDRMADKRRRSSAPTGRPGGAGIERGSAGPGGSQTRDVCYDAQGNRIDCVEASAIEAPEPGHPARAVAEEGFMGFGKKDAGGEDADGDGCVDAAAGPCKRCKNKGGKWIAGQGGAGKCVYGDITEAQIREIVNRIIKQLRETKKNG